MKLNEGVSFCSGCGAKTGEGAAVQSAPVSAAPSPSIMVRDFRCNSCGAPLKIPDNSRSSVRCPSCETECIIEGLIKNAEIADKENINSGLHLFASPAALHKVLINVLSQSPFLPLDALDKIVVVREERHCVPAYCFYCNATASFTYEKGVERKETYNVVRKDSKGGIISDVKEKTHIDWHPGSSSASVSQTVFVPGNRKMASQTMKLYSSFDSKKLIDIEQMNFPADVVTYNYDMPQAAVFSEYVLPDVDKTLKDKANSSVSNQNVRNLSMGGSNVQKDVVRVFFGLYRVVYRYNDNEYSVWITGDGKKFFHDGIPEDQVRKNTLAQKQRDLAAIPKRGLIAYVIGIATCVFAAIIIHLSALAGLALFVPLLIYQMIQNKKFDEQRSIAKIDIENFQSQLPTIIQEFIDEEKSLHGIYERDNFSNEVILDDDIATSDTNIA